MSSSVPELIFNLLIHICFLWWFLTSFFFLYVRHIEEEKIASVLKDFVNDALDKNMRRGPTKIPTAYSGFSLPPDMMHTVHTVLADKRLSARMDRAIDAELTLNNYKALTHAIGIGALITFVTVLVYAFFRDSINLKSVITENLLVFAMIGGFEFLFFTKFALNFEPVSPSNMMDLVRAYKAGKV